MLTQLLIINPNTSVGVSALLSKLALREAAGQCPCACKRRAWVPATSVMRFHLRLPGIPCSTPMPLTERSWVRCHPMRC